MVVLVLVGVVYFFFLRGDSPADAPLLQVSAGDTADTLLGRDLLAALAQLKSVKLDQTIFETEVFASLHDFGVDIAKQNVGRRNPFAPTGSSVTLPPRTTTSPTPTAPRASASSPTPPPVSPSGGAEEEPSADESDFGSDSDFLSQ